MDWLELPERQTEITVAPVTWTEYVRFARETKRPVPPRSGSVASPVIQVSVEEAGAFAAWLSRRDSYDYRLPTLAELLALTRHDQDGLTGNRSDKLLQFGAAEDGRFLSEWLHCAPDHGDGRSGLRCVANGSWPRKKGATHMRGALSEGRYTFVTFRLARANRRRPERTQ